MFSFIHPVLPGSWKYVDFRKLSVDGSRPNVDFSAYY